MLLRGVLPDIAPNIVVSALVLCTTPENVLWPFACLALVEVFSFGDLAGPFLNVTSFLGCDGAPCCV